LLWRARHGSTRCSSSPPKAATAALKDIVIKLIMLPVERYNQAEATMSTLLEKLLTHEHLAAPLAELMHKMHDGVPHVKALLSELATLEGADTGADAVEFNPVLPSLNRPQLETPQREKLR